MLKYLWKIPDGIIGIFAIEDYIKKKLKANIVDVILLRAK